MKAESTTGDETAKTQKQVVIYLLADDHIEVEVQPLTMGDLCEIVGTDRKVADFVKQMPVAGLQPQETGRRDRKSTRLNSSHVRTSRMPSSA